MPGRTMLGMSRQIWKLCVLDLIELQDEHHACAHIFVKTLRNDISYRAHYLDDL